MRKRISRAVAAVAATATLLVTIGLQPAAAQDTEAAEAPVPVILPAEFWWWLDDLHEFLIGLGGRPAIEATIRDAAAEFGVSPELMLTIARCESGLNPAARNRSSGAAGLGQHIPRYYPGRALAVGYPEHQIDPFRPRQNARVSAWLLATQGTRPWNPSRHCWGR